MLLLKHVTTAVAGNPLQEYMLGLASIPMKQKLKNIKDFCVTAT